MSDYNNAWDALGEAIGAAQGRSTGSFANQEALTVDQRLKAAEIAALLSISQELSQIYHEGLAPLLRAIKRDE